MAMVEQRAGVVMVPLTIRVAWWVYPYLATAALFVRLTATFSNLSDEQIGRFVDMQASFVASRGIRFFCGGRRV
jgi:hypothetical protein